MDDLFCDEVSVLLEVPDVQHNSLETPEELLDDDDCASIDTFLGSLPSCSSEDHAHGRLHVLLELEARQRTSDYLRRQPHFDSTHRFSIVQWLHVACFHFKLNLSALAIAVRLLDRFLDVCLVPADQLKNAQCVAVACLTLAAKLDGPEAVDNVAKFQVDTSIWSTDFSASQIKQMELMICATLDWRTHCATPVDFMDCLLALANVGRCPKGNLVAGGHPAARVRSAAHHLILATLADSNSIAMRPSCMAAASILSALRSCYGIGPEYSQTYACFALYIEQEEMQWCLDQLRNNSSRSSGGANARSSQPPVQPVFIPAKAPPLAAYSKDECSPTSVLASLPSLPLSQLSQMSCDSSCSSI